VLSLTRNKIPLAFGKRIAMCRSSSKSVELLTTPTISLALQRWTKRAVLFVIVLHVGCSKHEESLRVDTGADAVAQEFFDGLLHQDWRKAYATLDSTSKAWCSEQRFAELAASYLKEFGFNPESVNVSVSESGDQASAIAVFRAPSISLNSHFKDGAELKRNRGNWFVVLRTNFGKKASIPGARNG